MAVDPDSTRPDPTEGPGGEPGDGSSDARRRRALTRRRRILRGAVVGGGVASVAAYIGLLVLMGDATATPRHFASESPVGVASTTNNAAGVIAVALAVVIAVASALVALRAVFARHPGADHDTPPTTEASVTDVEDTRDRTDRASGHTGA